MSSGKFTNSTDRMLGVDGAGQVDLQSGVDGDNLIVLRDDKRVVDVIHRVVLDGRVIVEEVVQACCLIIGSMLFFNDWLS